MSFAPTTFDPLSYFREIGIVGGSTGLSPIIRGGNTIPPLDAYASGTTFDITDNVLKCTAGGGVNFHCSWDLGGSFDKVFALGYFVWGTVLDVQAIIVSENTYSGSQATQNYMDDYARNLAYSYSAEMRLQKRIGGTYTNLGTDTTIYPYKDAPTAPAYGLALYAESGDPGVQKGWIQFGSTSEWFELYSATDGALTSGFQTVGIEMGYNAGNVGRMITPFYVWGA